MFTNKTDSALLYNNEYLKSLLNQLPADQQREGWGVQDHPQ